MTLLESAVEGRGHSDALWVGASGERNAETLRSTAARSAEALKGFSGETVAVAIENPDLLVSAYALLDGSVGALLLVPGGLDRETTGTLLRKTGVDALITDSEMAFDTLPVARISTDQEGLPLLHRSDHKGSPRERAASSGTTWILATSGTTGAPKLVAHSLSSLIRTVRRDDAHHRWGLLYDGRRFAGLQVILQSLLSRSTLLLADPVTSLDARVAFLAARGCDSLSATATLWRKLLMTPDASGLALRQVTLGGEIADRVVLAALARAYPTARITHIYASTEVGVGFAVHDGRPGFPDSYLEQPPAPGVELAVNDEGHLLVRLRSKRGGDSEGIPMAVDSGWVDTGDLVRHENDRFYFRGRANGAISVGGDMVYPEEVEAVLYEVPGVASCAARARKSSLAGALVAVSVVSDGTRQQGELRNAIRRHCNERLPRHKVPALIVFEDDLKITAAGKTVRTP